MSRKLVLFCIGLAIILIGINASISTNKELSPKNHVPVQMVSGQDLIDLKQQFADAKAQQQNFQVQLDQLKQEAKSTSFSCDNPNNKCGAAEKTNVGVITDFGAYDLVPGTQNTDFYVGFNFTERTGFSKHFFPVCPNQTLKTGIPIVILYHWRNWSQDSVGNHGCFIIDGFQND